MEVKSLIVIMKSYRYLKDLILVLISSFLLILSFPDFELGFLAWIGLLPLFIAINGRSLRYSFFCSLVCGVLYFLGISRWIFEVPGYTIIHHVIMIPYLGLYFGLFGLAFNFISTRWVTNAALLAAPFIWVSLEYVRANLSFLSLPWELLAHTQYQYPSIIQIASFAGTYSISFLIVLVNAALAAVIYPFLSKFSEQEIPPSPPLEKGGATVRMEREAPSSKGRKYIVITAASLITGALVYGILTTSKPIMGEKIKISIVQGNIDQKIKWDPKFSREIMETYANLTQEAVKDQPAIIIWPETAVPGALGQNPKLYLEVTNISKAAGIPLLLGSAQYRKFEGKKEKGFRYWNSAFLVHPGAEKARNQRYDKIRLFPFGEYLPYKEFIPWSYLKVRQGDEYIPGEKFTVFEMPSFKFGVVICFESAFPDLCRQFILRGAQCLINLTNEAHFGKTAAPHQLASMSVFRAVENRVFVVRSANTGVSCIIDPYGRIVDRVKDQKGQDIFVRGIMSGWLIPLDSKTIYTRYGDLIVWVASLVTAVFLIIAFWHNRRKGRIH